MLPHEHAGHDKARDGYDIEEQGLPVSHRAAASALDHFKDASRAEFRQREPALHRTLSRQRQSSTMPDTSGHEISRQ